MKIYIIHIDALEGKKNFREFTDEEVVKLYNELYKEDSPFISCYDSLEEIVEAWNEDTCFAPYDSYMRVIDDEKLYSGLSLYDLAEKFIEKNDRNFYANDIKVPIKFFGHEIDVETIWYDDKGFGTYFLLCHCEEFGNADIAIESLSEENQKILAEVFKAHI